MSFKFKKGERVLVIAGKDKNKSGTVEKVFPVKNKLIVSGLNTVTKSVKPNQKNPNGGIEKISLPIDASNVSHIDPRLEMPTRIGYKIDEKGMKVKFSKKSKEIITV